LRRRAWDVVIAGLVAAVVAFTLLGTSPSTAASPSTAGVPSTAAALPGTPAAPAAVASKNLLYPIKHVIFVYRENHSFDNVFGPYCAQKPAGYCDGHVGNVTFSDGHTYTTQPATDVVPGVCHTVQCQNWAMNGGRMDGWNKLLDCGPWTKFACLQQFQPKQIPILTTLANHGVLSDRFFSEPDPSAGSHLFFATGEDTLGFTGDTPLVTPNGYTGRNGWACDSNKQADWINPANGQLSEQFFCNPNASWLPNGGAPGPTAVKGAPDFFTSILDAHGISWKNYGESGQHSVYQWNLPPYQAAALAKDATRMVAERTVITNAATGQLPQVSFVTPSHDLPRENTSQHNTTSMNAGDNFITKLMASLLAGPDAATTAVLITWDDCGCFYDHVPPPPGLGIRVPLLIWSAWSKGGYVDHWNAQFASTLSFIEHVFGLPSLTSLNPRAEDGRVPNDLLTDFDFHMTLPTAMARVQALAAALPPEEPIPPAERAWLAKHSSEADGDDT
jgi:phospholipase C